MASDKLAAIPKFFDPRRYYVVYQIMFSELISLGMSAFVFAIKTSENVKRTVATFAADGVR